MKAVVELAAGPGCLVITTPVPEEAPPAEAQTGTEAASDSGTTAEVQTGTDDGTAGSTLPVGTWIALGAALIAAMAAVLLAMKRKKDGAQPADSLGASPANGAGVLTTVKVGKLHEQGARKSQQDCFAVSSDGEVEERGILAVVADGMGGLSDGDKVSQTVAATMMQEFFAERGEPQKVLMNLVEKANRAVNSLPGMGGPGKSGSTLVAGIVTKDSKFHYISVGDSRIALYRDGALYQLNREHVYGHELNVKAINDEGTFAEAQSNPRASGLTSYIGMGKLKYVDIPARPISVRRGDKFVLMSDGVFNALSDEELMLALDNGAQEAAAALKQAISAKAYTNQDNYTAVILEC